MAITLSDAEIDNFEHLHLELHLSIWVKYIL